MFNIFLNKKYYFNIFLNKKYFKNYYCSKERKKKEGTSQTFTRDPFQDTLAGLPSPVLQNIR
jgi:hypothetical protein